jgi:pentatricopeptide repeat protein
MFCKMQEAGTQPDKAACNILVEKYSKAGETRALTLILQYMKESRLVLRYPIFLEALKALKINGASTALLMQVNPHFSTECVSKEKAGDLRPTAADVPFSIDRGLLLMFLKKRNLVAIDRLLTGIIDKNIRLDSEIISSIVEANCDRCRRSGALLAFKYSVRMGITIERNAYLSLIGILMRSNSFSKVVEIVEAMIRTGQSLGTYQSALLIYRLGCARRAVYGGKIFDLLPDDQKNTATFTALIGVYFTVGNADEGLKICRTMLEKGIYPALGTYNVLLAGLENSGRISEAEVYRKEKKSLELRSHSRVTVSLEEKICDLLFAGEVVS